MRTICVALLILTLGSFACGCKKRTASTDTASSDNKDKASPPLGTPDPAAGTPGTAGKRGTFTIGTSTTYVTGPKTASGHIDFAEAFNDRLSKGVTPENNANVAIWKAIGPTPYGQKMPAGFFEKLGMQQPPRDRRLLHLAATVRGQRRPAGGQGGV